MPPQLHEQFVVDAKGHRQGVMLSWTEYQHLLRTVEGLEDALDLKHAVRTAKQFLSHDALLKSLKHHAHR
ncbi:MAG: hypothetical protein HY737_00500 [Candidatus Omnitrophica bacterium]|nr:hypothetical protein [Candidatus Omnitrophota bacterium]